MTKISMMTLTPQLGKLALKRGHHIHHLSESLKFQKRTINQHMVQLMP